MIPIGQRHIIRHTACEAGQAAGFCVDVNAITRTNNLFTGDLNIPVLFVEDFRLRP